MKYDIPHFCSDCKTRYKSIFCDLEEEELTELSTGKGCSYYKKGQIIFTEGSFPHYLYCVNSGKVKIFQTNTDGKEHIIRLVKPADLLGYRALLSGEQYTCSAMALDDSAICLIPKKNFFDLLSKNININYQMINYLSKELKDAELKMSGMAMKPVRERIAEAVLYLREIYGLEKDKETLNLIMSRIDIAAIAGTSRELVIRHLYEFAEQEIIELVGKKIKIVNFDKLIHIANLTD